MSRQIVKILRAMTSQDTEVLGSIYLLQYNPSDNVHKLLSLLYNWR
jgi:hypothetical protein